MIALNANIEELRQEAQTVESYIYSTYLAIFKTISEDKVIYKLAHNNEKVIENLYGCSVIVNSLNLLAKDINDAISRSLLPNIDAELLAAAFLGVANQLGLRVAETTDPDPESTARFAERLFMGGINSASKKPARRFELESA